MANDYYKLPGYQNPLGGGGGSSSGSGGTFNPPGSLGDFGSWQKDTDWGGASKGTDWGGGFGVDKSGLWEKSFGQYSDPEERYLNKIKKDLFDKAGKKRDDSDEGYGGGFGATIGKGLEGGASQVLENLGVVMPQQHAPVVVQGAPGKRGFGSVIGGIGGAIAGSLIPGVGTGLGYTIGSGVGGAF